MANTMATVAMMQRNLPVYGSIDDGVASFYTPESFLAAIDEALARLMPVRDEVVEDDNEEVPEVPDGAQPNGSGLEYNSRFDDQVLFLVERQQELNASRRKGSHFMRGALLPSEYRMMDECPKCSCTTDLAKKCENCGFEPACC